MLRLSRQDQSGWTIASTTCCVTAPWSKPGVSCMRAIMARRLVVSDDDPVFQHGLQDVIRGAARFERAIRTSGREVTHSDPQAAVEFAYRLIVATAHRWAAREIEVMAPEPMSWEAMLANLSETVARYLFGEPLSSRGR